MSGAESVLIDTSGLVAAVDPRQAHHEAARHALTSALSRVVSPFVLAECDYLITRNAGQAESVKLLRDVENGAYQLAPFSNADIAEARPVIEQYSDLGLGLADASIVVLAHRYNCWDILSLDERHFRAVTGPNGRSFRLLPLDSG